MKCVECEMKWNTCDKKLVGEMNSVKEKYPNKISLVNFQNTPL